MTFTIRPSITVDGAPLDAGAERRLARVVVDNHLHLPDMFALHFDDVAGGILGQARLRIGGRIVITAEGQGRDASQQLLSGEITALEADYGDHGCIATVRGYDMSHRLHRGRRTATYLNVKDSDIAQQIASGAGLTVGTVDDSRATIDHVSQHNLSDWDFLKSRAREIGFEMTCADGRFHFRRPVQSSSGPQPAGDRTATQPTQLVFGRDLLEFRPRVSSAQQVSQVTVRTWDQAQKQVVTGQAQAGSDHASLSTDPRTLAGQFSSPDFTAHDHPVKTQSEADAVAQSMAQHIGSGFADAEGVTLGNPNLRAGVVVAVGEVGTDFAGQYVLTQVSHVFEADATYRTHFQVAGQREPSLLGMMTMGQTNGSASAGARRIEGLVIAQVSNADDPDSHGRVKLRFPWLSDDYESDWCRVSQLGAGPQSGAVWLPEVNDEVLCGFEFGDIRRPFVIGGLYNGQDTPLLGSGLVDNGHMKRRGFISRRGHRFVFFDDSSKSGIGMLSSDGNLKLSLNESNGEIHIHAQGQGKVTVATDSGDVTVNGGGSVTIQAGQDLTLKANSSINIQASGQLKLQGATINLN